MTAFTTAQLPAGARAITTVEQLALWCAQVLQACNAADRIVLEAGQPSQLAQRWGVGVDSDNIQRYQIVLMPKIDPTLIGQSLPDWKLVKESGSTAIPTAFSG